MSSSGSTTVRQAYRTIVRALNKHVTGVANNKQWVQFVQQEFRKPSGQAGDADSVKKMHLAEDYAFLLGNVAHHRDLLALYNIGLDPDVRNKMMVEKTARRVGFSLPEEAPSKKSGQEQDSQQ